MRDPAASVATTAREPLSVDLTCLHCASCGWTFHTLAAAAPQAPCPHCWRAAPRPAPHAAPSEVPAVELAVPFTFTVTDATLDTAFTAFVQSIPSPPPDLEPTRLRQRVRKMMLPVYLIDAEVNATWQAQAGFDRVVLSHREHARNASWQTEQVEETRVHWEPRVGRLTRRYDNVQAPALEEHDDLMQRLGAFDTTKAIAATTDHTCIDALCRLPDRTRDDAWVEAKAGLLHAAAEECRVAAGADHIREFHWNIERRESTWTLLHLPVYATSYADDSGQPQPILINGQTGQVWGKRKGSRARARSQAIRRLVIAAVVLALALVIALVGLALPPLMPVAGAAALGAFACAISAMSPVWNVRRFNQEEAARDGSARDGATKARSPT